MLRVDEGFVNKIGKIVGRVVLRGMQLCKKKILAKTIVIEKEFFQFSRITI